MKQILFVLLKILGKALSSYRRVVAFAVVFCPGCVWAQCPDLKRVESFFKDTIDFSDGLRIVITCATLAIGF